jgi:DNA-binding FrmR family transcriptional regulator
MTEIHRMAEENMRAAKALIRQLAALRGAYDQLARESR